MLRQLQQIVRNIVGTPTKNSMSLPARFLRYGNRAGSLKGSWSDVVMSDRDVYSGYGYAAIRNRANTVARVAINHITTESKNKKDHPYLETISRSPTFSDYQFWHDISVYLDLEGAYYLMPIRAIGGVRANSTRKRLGDVQEFKMLNPYHIRRVMKNDEERGPQIGGYIENRNGLIREIPPEMIIEIRDLNPFDDEKPFSMTDAGKESQYTLKSAGDYTRNAMAGNINAPGILSTDVTLPDEEFEKFVARVRNHEKGEPLFGNGTGAIDWKSMDTNLKEAALDVVKDMGRDEFLAVAGMSKTLMGIEQSGVTRETSKTQKDLLIEMQVLPRIQLIIDTLNQDYKNNYPEEYNSSAAIITVTNPLATDFDASAKEVEVKKSQFDLYTDLVNKGYDPKLAAQYVNGEIDLIALGTPTNEPKEDTKDDPEPEDNAIEKETIVENAAENSNTALIAQSQSSLQNSIINLEGRMVANVISNVRKVVGKTANAFGEPTEVSESDLMTKTEKKDFINELLGALVAFYGIVFTLQGSKVMKDRAKTYDLDGDWSLDKEINSYIKKIAKKVSESHINTIIDDLYEQVRADALKGASLEDIVSSISTKYSSTITENRAKTIARTETNRAFTRAQFEADRQFVEQNKLRGRVFKQWVTRSDNPCDFCRNMAARGAIPFDAAFADVGDEINADGKKYTVAFETVEAGNLHPNCSCAYELIIESPRNNVYQKEQEIEDFTNEVLDIISQTI